MNLHGYSHRLMMWLAAGMLLFGAVPAAQAQLPGVSDTEETGKEAAAPVEQVSEEVASPRDTIYHFLLYMGRVAEDHKNTTAWEHVYETLEIPASIGAARQEIAIKLLGIFNALGRIDVDKMAPDMQAVEEQKLSRFQFLPDNPYRHAQRLIKQAIDDLDGQPPPGVIELVKTETGEWKFSQQTIEDIGKLWNWIERRGAVYGIDITELSTHERLRKRLIPASLKGRFILGNELWQWVGLLILLVVAVVVHFIGRGIFRGIVRWITGKYTAGVEDAEVRETARPIALFLSALVFLLLLTPLQMVGTELIVIVTAVKVVLIASAAWVGTAITSLVADVFLKRAADTESTFDDMIIPLLRRTVKLVILAFAFVYVAGVLDINILPLLGSLGLVGLAFSFAAQDMIRNLFGGVAIFLDKPFQTGERILYQGYDGIVEGIGFRSTKVRTLTGHVVTIPNAGITNDPVENVGRRPCIRRIMNVTITYDTPRAKIEQAVQILRDILEEEGIREPINPTIKGDEYPPRVYFNDYNAESLNIFLIYWYAPPAYWDYLEHAQRLNLRIFEAFEDAGIDFAFPTQTLYLAGDTKRELSLRMLGADLENRPG